MAWKDQVFLDINEMLDWFQYDEKHLIVSRTFEFSKGRN